MALVPTINHESRLRVCEVVEVHVRAAQVRDCESIIVSRAEGDLVELHNFPPSEQPNFETEVIPQCSLRILLSQDRSRYAFGNCEFSRADATPDSEPV